MLKWTNPLPTKPSALIRVALDDLENVENNPAYVVNMLDWHRPEDGEGCNVCLAGAVLACNTNLKANMEYNPFAYSPAFNAPLFALDSFRVGDVFEGLRDLGITKPKIEYSRWNVTPYEDSPVSFKRDMRAIADYLEKHGY